MEFFEARYRDNRGAALGGNSTFEDAKGYSKHDAQLESSSPARGSHQSRISIEVNSSRFPL
jgi:hypothetical protein